MPFAVRFCEIGFYWIAYSGAVDLDQRLAALAAVEKSSKDSPIKGNLVDFRDARLSCSFSEQFRFATTATNQTGHRGKKAAYLFDQIDSAPVEILQLAMSNRGIETRLFSRVDEAFDWLTNSCYKSCPVRGRSTCLLNEPELGLRFSPQET